MKLSSQEKKALAGMAVTAGFVAASIWEIGKLNFWFEAKNSYHTYVGDADGLRVGSVVTVAGLRVGEVSDLDVDESNRIAVTLSVRRTVAPRIRADSVVSISRAFMIGEKRVDLIPGTAAQPELADGATMRADDTSDLTGLMSGKKLAELMGRTSTMISSVSSMLHEMDEVVGKYHAGAFSQTLTRVEPALLNFIKLSDDLLVMTNEMKKKSKELPAFVDNGAQVLADLRKDFFANKLAKDAVEKLNLVMAPIAQRQQLIASILDNLQDLSNEIKANPGYTGKMTDAVDDLSVTLRALQKTWFLEDQTAEVKQQRKAEAAAARKAE